MAVPSLALVVTSAAPPLPTPASLCPGNRFLGVIEGKQD